MRKYTLPVLALLTILSSGCSNHYYYPHYTHSEEPISLGTVQRKLQKGMGQDQVAYVLGAPNIVTRDKCGNEAWVYDKINTDVSVSQSQSGVWLILGATSSETCRTTTTQKSLTLIVKYDANSCVDTISYHTAEF